MRIDNGEYPPRHLWIQALQADKVTLYSFLGFLSDLEMSAVGVLKAADSDIARARLQVVDELRAFAVLAMSAPDPRGSAY